MDLEKFDEIAAEMNAEEVTTEEVTTGEELLNLAETEDLTDEQKREIFIEQLKESKIHFRPLKNAVKTTVIQSTNSLGWKTKIKSRETLTNVTVNQFGAEYKAKRQRKNKAQRKSRKLTH